MSLSSPHHRPMLLEAEGSDEAVEPRSVPGIRLASFVSTPGIAGLVCFVAATTSLYFLVQPSNLLATSGSAGSVLYGVTVERDVDMIEKELHLDSGIISYAERSAVGCKNEGLPLVLLHGYLDCWKSWTNILPSIPKGRRIISLTMRGWGDSSKTGEYTVDAYAEDVIAFLGKIGIHHCIIGGHSMGTLIATAVTARKPALVAGVILCSGFAKMNPLHVIDPSDNTTLGSLGKFINSLFPDGQDLNDDGFAFLKSFQLDDMEPFLQSGAVTREFEAKVMRWTLQGTPRSYREAWSNMLKESHILQLGSISVPVLIIWGTRDYITDISEQTRLHQALSKAEVTSKNVTHAPHAVIWTHGPRCAQHILHWLHVSSL